MSINAIFSKLYILFKFFPIDLIISPVDKKKKKKKNILN